MKKPIQIFKPGKHVAMSGAALSFSESDLAATAAAYDPAKHEAPLVVGHPKHDDPAYGWVGKLAFADPSTGSGRTDRALEIEPVQVNADFAELVAAGAFKKISASFYSPDSPSNPVPGVYYLRHVGFLGAQPPAVKGLRNPQFAEAEQGVVEFADWGDIQNASILRGLRAWLIGKFGLDEADKAIPGYAVQTVEQEAQKEDATGSACVPPANTGVLAGTKNFCPGTGGTPALHFTEPQPQGETMSDADKARLAALETENAALKAKEVAFAEAENKRAADARHAGHLAFAEGLVKEGKLLPAHKDVTVATLDFMAAPLSSPQSSGETTSHSTRLPKDSSQVAGYPASGRGGDGENHLYYAEFGEGDAKKPLLDGFKSMLQAQPRQIWFGEVSGAAGETAGTVNFAAPAGYSVDAAGMEVHARAVAYQKANPDTDYLSAVQAVSK